MKLPALGGIPPWGRALRHPEFIARQGRQPTGLLGSLVARAMAVETAPENALALELLQIRPTDRVLEIGFGHGRTVGRASALAHNGFVAGVDPAIRMLRMATRRNRRQIEEGRVELRLGDTSRLPFPDRQFDRVFSVHTIYFWEGPPADLREIRRVMKAGAHLVLGFRPRDARTSRDFPANVHRFYTAPEVQSRLEEAGYRQVRLILAQLSNRNMAFALACRAA